MFLVLIDCKYGVGEGWQAMWEVTLSPVEGWHGVLLMKARLGFDGAQPDISKESHQTKNSLSLNGQPGMTPQDSFISCV